MNSMSAIFVSPVERMGDRSVTISGNDGKWGQELHRFCHQIPGLKFKEEMEIVGMFLKNLEMKYRKAESNPS